MNWKTKRLDRDELECSLLRCKKKNPPEYESEATWFS